MKRIEEIEKMDFSQLEAVAEDSSIKAPSSLNRAIGAAITSASLRNERRASKVRTYSLVGAFATVAASLVIVFALPRQPKDTYDDPMLAYAQVEQAFALISSKMEKGIEIASQASPVIDKTTDVFNNR